MKNNIIMAISLSILMAACSSNSNNSNLNVSNNIDDLVHWGLSSSNILSGDAHSGLYSTKVDSLNPFSVTFQKKLTDISKTKITKIEYQAWVKTSILPKKIYFVCSVELENGEHILYEGTQIDKQVLKVNEWTLVKGFLDLTKEVPANTIVKIYFHSPEKESAVIDDYEINFIN